MSVQSFRQRYMDCFPKSQVTRPRPRSHSEEWFTVLSFQSLQSEGLVQTRQEYRALYNAFAYKKTNVKFVKEWLQRQKAPFRVSFLAVRFITNYARRATFDLYMIPTDVLHLILRYSQIMLAKLYTDRKSNEYEIRTLDANMRITDLSQMLHRERNKSNCKLVIDVNTVRLHCRWRDCKDFYVIHDDFDDTVLVDPSEAKEGSGEDEKEDMRWVEMADVLATKHWIQDIDASLPYYRVLEFGVDRVQDLQCYAYNRWSFDAQTDNDDEAQMSTFEWLSSLRRGDIVNVYNSDFGLQWEEGILLLHEFSTFHVYALGSDSMLEISSIGAENLWRMQRRYSRCVWNGQGRKRTNDTFEILLGTAWITNFQKAKMMDKISEMNYFEM